MKCQHLFDRLLSPDHGGYSDVTRPVLTAAKRQNKLGRGEHVTLARLIACASRIPQVFSTKADRLR